MSSKRSIQIERPDRKRVGLLIDFSEPFNRGPRLIAQNIIEDDWALNGVPLLCQIPHPHQVVVYQNARSSQRNQLHAEANHGGGRLDDT
jgi:hypothetical protein